MSRWQWLFSQLTKQLWFRISLFAVLAVVSALGSVIIKPYISPDIGGIIGAEAIDNILNILASSMLAVTTFSLSIMVSAYSSATTSVTPRATRLMMEDSITQNVLATFIGCFLFSMVGIVARSMGVYGEQGRVVLFLTTLAVIALMIVMLLRWIQHLSLLGRVGETTLRVEEATHHALLKRVSVPYMGGYPWVVPPKSASPVYATEIGYVQNIDVAQLNELAQTLDCEFYLQCQVGSFVHPAQALMFITRDHSDVDNELILNAITIHPERSFDQDPRFGLSVLAEIASRALSPAVNDPGTAIDVCGRAVRLLAIWGQKVGEQSTVIHTRIYVKPIQTADLFDDIFNPVARDGASLIEVQMRLVKNLQALALLNPALFTADVRRYLNIILDWADTKMESRHDRQRLQDSIMQMGLVDERAGL